MNFDNRVLGTIEIFGHTIWITETHRNTWIIMIFLIIAALAIRFFLVRKLTEIPTGKLNVLETIIEMFDNFVKSIMGTKYRGYGKWFFGVFVFIVASNFSGLVNLRPPTADIATTLALSVSTFAIMHFSGFLKNTKEYIKSFFEPWPIFFPVNVIGELSIPLSLGFRLFGNIISGFIIVGMIYFLLPWFLTMGLPAFLHAYFDVFAGLMQAFIFTMLSMTFVRNKLKSN